jgi:AraC family transcriptional regulator, exoenzyme S synthesis regulatory protein ExsA
MDNFLDIIKSNPDRFKQLNCDQFLLAEFNCPLQNNLVDTWSDLNYFVYIVAGRKIWHTAHAHYDLHAGDCIFVRKGANIIEQFFDAEFCILTFFFTDEFICDTLKRHGIIGEKSNKIHTPVIPIETDGYLVSFFQSMSPFFTNKRAPDKSLLELKFRELILNVVSNKNNKDISSYFSSLLNEPVSVSLMKIMEDNFCYNLKMEEFAQLCNRSLSAFKRDFQKIYNNTPGKWLLEKRLNHAKLILSRTDKTISEVMFDCGFENLSHFSRAFKAYFGNTPASVRQKKSAELYNT